MDVIHLTGKNEEATALRVVSLLRRGAVVAVPTDTVYGLVADIMREAAVKKVFRIKARSHAKALPVFVRDIATAKKYAYIEAELIPFLEKIWPGQTTAVFRKRAAMPDLVTGGQNSVALRVPDHPFLARVLAEFPDPLTATSGNISGSEPATSASEVQATFKNHIPRPDVVIDGGALPPSRPSTILDLTNPKNPKILRMGAITKSELDQLFVEWAKLKR